MADKAILAIDQGTTSSRAILFDASGQILATAQKEFRQIYPSDGWVEHDPEEIWSTTVQVCREVLASARVEVAGIGITNQRETTVVWERATGKPIYNAIVWQDRRTAARCQQLRSSHDPADVAARSGLLIDPYFSATKVAWILDHVEGARAQAERGDLAFGTVDSFLLWRLTGGEVHATDITNASRTNLFNIHKTEWDPFLLDLFQVPKSVLPEVKDCAAHFGDTKKDILGQVLPICGIAGDQQAAAIGQACLSPGMIKSTYGTGCFVILNTGNKAVASRNRLLTTIAYRVGNETSYAIEGSIFVSGAAVQWLRDGLGLIRSAAETEGIARGLDGNRGVYLVPAFTGLGAPYWDADARGGIFGLTRDTGPAEIVRATLESVAYQTRDLFAAMAEDGVTPEALRVDGGMVGNDWLMQFLADLLDIPVERPRITETTALGAGLLAALELGLIDGLGRIGEIWQREARFDPDMDGTRRQKLLQGWHRAVARIRSS